MKSILVYLAVLVSACMGQDIGYVDNFEVKESGDGYVVIAWDMVGGSTDYSLHKYSLVIDDDLKSEFKCGAASCERLIEDLDSCVEHVFDLTPVFYQPDGTDLEGLIATTSGYTKDEIPSEVTNIAVVSDTDTATTLQWNKPALNPKCVDVYEICFRLDATSDKLCVESNTTEASVHSLSACGKYHVTVTPLTPTNERGPTVEHIFTTHNGVPGEPQNVVVGLITKETIQLLWDNPTKNPLCLDKFLITIGETHGNSTFVMTMLKEVPGGYDNQFTFKPLSPCTDFTIDVCSANIAELTSDKVVRYASTEETVPLPPPSVTVSPNGDGSLLVSWGDNEKDRCAGEVSICWNDGVHPIEQCEVVGGDDNNLVITDLLPCSNYDVIVSVQSPDGTFTSNATTNSSHTADTKPGPVQDLQMTTIDTDQLTISYELPDIDPQCVKEIITIVIDEDTRALYWQGTNKQSVNPTSSTYQETINGLHACTNYRVKVSTKSISGLESDKREVMNTTLSAMTSAPQNLEENSVTDSSITLQWFQPATNPRCATQYSLSWLPGGSEPIIINSDASSFKVLHTVEGLAACTDYVFTLRAISPSGTSPEVSETLITECPASVRF